MDCDLVVIGSGFGGSVVAKRAAESGMKVVVLERGPRLDDGAFDDLRRGRRPLVRFRRNEGIFELHVLPRLLSLTSNAVGGGSHVYTGVTLPAPAEVFETHWPAGLTADRLGDSFRRVERIIRPTPIPTPVSRTSRLEELGQRMNVTARRLPVAMDWPSNGDDMGAARPSAGVRGDVVRWLRGGPTARKRTLDRTFLRDAEAAGAEIRPGHEVHAVVPSRDGYRTHFRRKIDGRLRKSSIESKRTVLAAGTLNTVRLLLTCRDRLATLPRLSGCLGRRFFTNGDFGAALVGPRLALEADGGPPVTGWLDLWDSDRVFLMETGMPPVLSGPLNALLGPVLRVRDLRHRSSNRAAARCIWTFGVMGYDDCPGELRLNRRGRLAYAPGRERDRAFIDRRLARLKELAAAAGATLLVPIEPPGFRHDVTIHPLGGAALADTPDEGVTDPYGEAFGHPGLYVADGALLPTPTGVPPSMTIAALADRVAEHLIRSC